jgi:hypothetical protein
MFTRFKWAGSMSTSEQGLELYPARREVLLFPQMQDRHEVGQILTAVRFLRSVSCHDVPFLP